MAKHQVRAVRRIGDAGGAAAVVAERRVVVLQNSAGYGVENSDGLWGAHLKDGGGLIASGVQRDSLGPGPDAQVDLGAGGG